MPELKRAFAETPVGQIHFAEAGEGDPPVLLLHQTPRSWDEYREALPLIGEHRRAIAMDTLGFGDSCEPAGDTIEEYAQGVTLLLDALGIERASLVGHHTGGVIAIEVAAEHPDRVDRLVLSSTPLVDEEFRQAHGDGPGVDDAERSHDGDHLLELWRQRQPFYPAERGDLLERYIVDALKAGGRMLQGHIAVARYEMEPRLERLSCPALVVAATADPHAEPHAEPLAERIEGARTVAIEGGMVPLPDQMPEAFARVVTEFVEA